MKVVEIATQADPEFLLAEYQRAYGTLHGHTTKTVEKWRSLVTEAVGVRDGTVVEIGIRRDEWGGKVEEYFDVGGRDPAGEKWSLSLTPFTEWRECEVEDHTGQNLSLDQMAAHLMYEMLWHGWPEETEAIADGLRDQVEQIDRDIASGVPLEELGYKTFKPGDDIKKWLED